MDLWMEENHKDLFAMRYRITDVLYSKKSPFQQVDVVQTAGFGKMMFLDHLVMVSERDEFIYHDMITHVALHAMPQARKVLIIGGGDGGTLREVLRHQRIEKVVMVEIDPLVVEAAQLHFPELSQGMKDPRAEVLIQDGVAFMAESRERFDLILIDSTDPIGPATPLFGEAFYRNVYDRLSEVGVVVAQGESCFYEPVMQQKLLSMFVDIFPLRGIYNYANMTYPGSLWSFVYGSKGCPIRKSHPEVPPLRCRYYNRALHESAFILPSFQLDSLADWISPAQPETT
jgi:spermidine synthase